MTEISIQFDKFSSFRSVISRKQSREIELQMEGSVSFSWFAGFGKTLTIIQRLTQAIHFLSTPRDSKSRPREPIKSFAFSLTLPCHTTKWLIFILIYFLLIAF